MYGHTSNTYTMITPTIRRRNLAAKSRFGGIILGLLLAIFTLASANIINTMGTEEHSIPTVSFSDLRKLGTRGNGNTDGVADTFRQVLSTNGLLAIRLEDFDDDEDLTGDSYSRDRRIALDGLCSCVDHPEFLELEQTHELSDMADSSSTSRTSVATATVGLENPLPLPKGMDATCGPAVHDAMEGLRHVVSSVSRAFVAALDTSVIQAHNAKETPKSTTLLRDEFGRSFESVADIVHVANHLEHFHVYTNNNNNSNQQENSNTAWDWHTDAGLFLVFVPAWDCNGSSDDINVDDSFYYRDTEGNTIRAKFDGGRTAIVMLGQGAQDWLDLPSPNPAPQQSMLKATTHSVRWSEQKQKQYPTSSFNHLPKQRRSWYGMMNLVPESALVYGGKTLRDVKQSLSLAHQHKTGYQPPASSEFPSNSMPLGCGTVAAPGPQDELYLELEDVTKTSRRRRHLQMQDAAMCNNVTNFFCWMTCMDIPKLDQAPLFVEAGYSLYCLDEATLRSSGDMTTAHNACIDVHNMGCNGLWEKTKEGIPASEIDVAAIEAGVGDIETPFCYSGTTMYMEGFQLIQSSTCVIMLFPSWVLNTPWKFVVAVIGTVLLAIGLEKFIQQRRKAMVGMEEGITRLVTSAVFYGVQLTIGYVLMLIIMIYSGVLFLAVILGLVIGHILFNARDAVWPIHESPQNLNDDESVDEEGSKDGDLKGTDKNKSELAKKSDCHNPVTNMLLKSKTDSERALREGSTHCQEFESDNDGHEYYGSLENGSNHKRPVSTSSFDLAGSGVRKSGASKIAFVEIGSSRQKQESHAPVDIPSDSMKKKGSNKRKTLDQDVPEGSTPCCQHG